VTDPSDYTMSETVPEPPPDSGHTPLPDDRRRVMPVGISTDLGSAGQHRRREDDTRGDLSSTIRPSMRLPSAWSRKTSHSTAIAVSSCEWPT
jgi:hypothetical protein